MKEKQSKQPYLEDIGPMGDQLRDSPAVPLSRYKHAKQRQRLVGIAIGAWIGMVITLIVLGLSRLLLGW